MRAARLNPKIQVVAINDPFIPVDYMKYMFYVSSNYFTLALNRLDTFNLFPMYNFVLPSMTLSTEDTLELSPLRTESLSLMANILLSPTRKNLPRFNGVPMVLTTLLNPPENS